VEVPLIKADGKDDEMGRQMDMMELIVAFPIILRTCRKKNSYKKWE